MNDAPGNCSVSFYRPQVLSAVQFVGYRSQDLQQVEKLAEKSRKLSRLSGRLSNCVRGKGNRSETLKTEMQQW